LTSASEEADVRALQRPLRLLGLAAFASMAAMRWCDSLLPLLATEFGASTGQAAQTVSAFALAYGLMQFVVGPLGDRRGKLHVVSLAAVVCMLGALASAAAPSLGWLTVARAATGGAAAAVVPLTFAWIGDRVPPAQRQAVLARMLGATITGMIAGQWLAGVFADRVGWRTGFVVLAAGFGVAALALRWNLARGLADAPATSQLSPLRQMAAVLALPPARWLFMVVAAEGAFAFSAMTFVPSHLQQRFGLSASMAGAVLAAYGIGGLLYSRGAPWLLRRLGMAPMARVGAVMVALSWLGLAALPDWRWAPPLCAVAGLGFYMLHNSMQNLATQVAPEARGTAVSMFACSLFIGQSAGVALASWGVDHSSAALPLWVAPWGLLAVGFVFAAGLKTSAPAERAGH
jgi:predicted MFS family arabinose efflux permease